MSGSRGDLESMEDYQNRMKAVFMGIDHRLKGRLAYFSVATRVDFEGGYRYQTTAEYRKQV